MTTFIRAQRVGVIGLALTRPVGWDPAAHSQSRAIE